MSITQQLIAPQRRRITTSLSSAPHSSAFLGTPFHTKRYFARDARHRLGEATKPPVRHPTDSSPPTHLENYFTSPFESSSSHAAPSSLNESSTPPKLSTTERANAVTSCPYPLSRSPVTIARQRWLNSCRATALACERGCTSMPGRLVAIKT